MADDAFRMLSSIQNAVGSVESLFLKMIDAAMYGLTRLGTNIREKKEKESTQTVETSSYYSARELERVLKAAGIDAAAVPSGTGTAHVVMANEDAARAKEIIAGHYAKMELGGLTGMVSLHEYGGVLMKVDLSAEDAFLLSSRLSQAGISHNMQESAEVAGGMTVYYAKKDAGAAEYIRASVAFDMSDGATAALYRRQQAWKEDREDALRKVLLTGKDGSGEPVRKGFTIANDRRCTIVCGPGGFSYQELKRAVKISRDDKGGLAAVAASWAGDRDEIARFMEGVRPDGGEAQAGDSMTDRLGRAVTLTENGIAFEDVAYHGKFKYGDRQAVSGCLAWMTDPGSGTRAASVATFSSQAEYQAFAALSFKERTAAVNERLKNAGMPGLSPDEKAALFEGGDFDASFFVHVKSAGGDEVLQKEFRAREVARTFGLDENETLTMLKTRTLTRPMTEDEKQAVYERMGFEEQAEGIEIVEVEMSEGGREWNAARDEKKEKPIGDDAFRNDRSNDLFNGGPGAP